jgi:hypothetical protein
MLDRLRVHRSATDRLKQVPLCHDKREVSAPTLWAALLVAAVEVTSILAACERLDGLAPEEAIRKAL